MRDLCRPIFRKVSSIRLPLASGQYTLTGLPRMGPVANCDGAYLASGHSCWGILNAPASGAAMAELILKGRAETVDLRPFDPRRQLGICRTCLVT